MNRSTLFALFLVTLDARAGSADEPHLPRPPDPTAEHKFLKRFAGEWECANVGYLESKEIKSKGTMSGKMVGEYWAVIAVTAESHDGPPFQGQGTWTDSMSSFLWKYEGKSTATN